MLADRAPKFKIIDMAVLAAYIGIGSNVGDRAETMLKAIMMLDHVEQVRVCRISQMIETEPVGAGNQPKYLNGAAQIDTSLSPMELLSVLHEIEEALGRNRQVERRWGPRTCDLDILLMGQEVLEADSLTVPHPRLHERMFVLRPLAEIAPNVRHPVLCKTVSEMLTELEAKG